MHKEAYENAKKFVLKYLWEKFNQELLILDVGSYNVNGTLKPLFSNPKWKYFGLDITSGDNVDIVLTDPYKFLIEDNYFDVIVSSSCLEHDPMFWLTFKEMVRVCKDGGLIYLNVPSTGYYHPYPLDCWRFKEDAYKGLSEWCKEAKLVESYIDKSCSLWEDSVGIFKIEKNKK